MTLFHVAAIVAWIILGVLILHSIWLRIKLDRQINALSRRVEELCRVRNALDGVAYSREQRIGPDQGRDSLELVQLRRVLDESVSRNPGAHVTRLLVDEFLAWPDDQRGTAILVARKFLEELRDTGEARVTGTYQIKDGEWTTKVG